MLALLIPGVGMGGGTASAPVFSGPIPNITETENTGTHAYDLGQYFTFADSYSIAPAVETGWTFNTTTGELVIDTDVVGVFGPFVVTGTNIVGSDDSNGFTVTVSAAPVQAAQTPAGRAAKRKRRYTVVIDDQEFEVNGYDQAVALLEQAKSLAQTHAVDSAKRIEKRIRRRGKIGEAQIPAPTLSTPDPSLKEIVSSYREQIRGIYLEAATAAELRELLRRKFREEDEDDAEILLLH